MLPLSCAWYCGVGTLAILSLVFFSSFAIARRIRRRRWLKTARAYRAERKVDHV